VRTLSLPYWEPREGGDSKLPKVNSWKKFSRGGRDWRDRFHKAMLSPHELGTSQMTRPVIVQLPSTKEGKSVKRRVLSPRWMGSPDRETGWEFVRAPGRSQKNRGENSKQGGGKNVLRERRIRTAGGAHLLQKTST